MEIVRNCSKYNNDIFRKKIPKYIIKEFLNSQYKDTIELLDNVYNYLNDLDVDCSKLTTISDYCMITKEE